MTKTIAPKLQTSQWLNTEEDITLESLRGKIIIIEAFQMLCPACVSHSLPQALRIKQAFSTNEVAVLGLHTVFEHHDAMTPTSLKAFLHENRIGFPVGVDLASKSSPIPKTMHAYNMRGTPTLLIIDKEGHLKHHIFGQVDDIKLGAEIQGLISAK